MKYRIRKDNNYLKFGTCISSRCLDGYNEAAKEFFKTISGTKRLEYTKCEGIPDILPAYAHDVGNYVARYGGGNYQIQFILKFDGKLNFERLSRAVRLSVDEEPVLGCRFIAANPPYWKRLDDIDNTKFCWFEETDNADKVVNDFLESRIDMDHDPMVKVKLIRTLQNDILGIKINHTCCDGAGAKEYLHLLERIYSALDRYGEYKVIPSVRDREDHYKALNTLGIKYPIFDMSVIETPKTVWPFSWKSGGKKNITPFVLCSLPQGQLDILRRYGKEKGATINDLLLTAYYRAMFKITHVPYGIPMDLGLTLDLRRYLPDNKANAIRNFSGGIVLSIPRVSGEPFDKTLSRIVSTMKIKKDMNPGYQGVTGAERAEFLNAYQILAYAQFYSMMAKVASEACYFCSPGLSNVGYLSNSLIKFGTSTVNEAYIFPPVVRQPTLLLVASTYNGVLTIATGYYKDSINRKYIEKLLNEIKDELMQIR